MALTLCTTTDITDLAGYGANATITASSTILTRYGNNAEGIVISETRRDWITGYASVNTYVKFLLTNATASLAALWVVLYDARGYTSRLEQGTIAQNLINNYNNAIKLLSELDANSIRTVTA